MELVRFLAWVLIYFFALNSGETPLHTVLKEARVCAWDVQIGMWMCNTKSLLITSQHRKKRCNTCKGKTLLPLLKSSRIISVPLQFVYSPICICCLLEGNEGMTGSSNNSVILVLWPLKSVSKQRAVSVLFFRRLTHAIDQCLDVLRKAKIFHKSPKKTNLSLRTECEMCYRWAGPPAKGLCLSQHLPSLTECAGNEAEGVTMRNQSTVLMTSSSFTLHTVL